jgi:hypothetical protein
MQWRPCDAKSRDGYCQINCSNDFGEHRDGHTDVAGVNDDVEGLNRDFPDVNAGVPDVNLDMPDVNRDVPSQEFCVR